MKEKKRVIIDTCINPIIIYDIFGIYAEST